MKVKIKSIEKKTWQDKTFYDILLEGDDKQYTCWNDSVKSWEAGQEVDATTSEKDTDKGKKYYIRAEQQKGGGGKWQPRDKREIAVNCATAITCKMVEKAASVETDNTLIMLEVIYKHIYNLIKD